MKFWVLDRILRKPLASRQIEYLAINRNFHILEISEGVERFADCSQDIQLENDIRVCFPELIGYEDELLKILSGEQEIFELKGIARSSEPNYPLYIDIYVVNDEYEDPLESRLMVLVEDTTERMVSEQILLQRVHEANLLTRALEATKDYIEKIINSMSEVLLVTTKTGKIKRINKACQDLLGYSEEELIGQSIFKIIDGNDSLLRVNNRPPGFDELLKSIEIICQSKNGEKIVVSFSCSIIHTEIDGVQDFIYIGRDITEQQLVQKTQGIQYSTSSLISESVFADTTNREWVIGNG